MIDNNWLEPAWNSQWKVTIIWMDEDSMLTCWYSVKAMWLADHELVVHFCTFKVYFCTAAYFVWQHHFFDVTIIIQPRPKRCYWQSSSTTGCHWQSSSTTGCHWLSSSTTVGCLSTIAYNLFCSASTLLQCNCNGGKIVTIQRSVPSSFQKSKLQEKNPHKAWLLKTPNSANMTLMQHHSNKICFPIFSTQNHFILFKSPKLGQQLDSEKIWIFELLHGQMVDPSCP